MQKDRSRAIVDNTTCLCIDEAVTEMEEIIMLDATKRWPSIEELNIPPCVVALAETLDTNQRYLLAEVIRMAEEGEDFDVLRQCLISPKTYSEDLRQAQRAIDRRLDGKLYSQHLQ